MIEFKEPIDWIKFNANEVGYYRVNYESTEWNVLCKLLQCQHNVNFDIYLSFFNLTVEYKTENSEISVESLDVVGVRQSASSGRCVQSGQRWGSRLRNSYEHNWLSSTRKARCSMECSRLEANGFGYFAIIHYFILIV